jgi:hypothetical protein
MVYDPFARGPFPVGVDTLTVRDLTVEVWYPAVSSSSGLDLRAETRDRFRVGAEEHWQAAVRDAVPRLGSFPLALYAHPGGGHRRDGAQLCTHLASHGYVVAAADHPERADLDARPGELSAVIDRLVAGRGGPGATYLDRERIAVLGTGLGGWTALAAVAAYARIGVAAVVSPAIAEAEAGAGALETGWPRLVPTLIVSAEGPALDEARELNARLRTPRRLLVLGSDGEADVLPGVTLAHLDAHLRDVDEARDLLADDLARWLEPRGARAAWEG